MTHELCESSFSDLIVNYFNTEVSKLFHPWVAWYNKMMDLLNDEGFSCVDEICLYTCIIW